MTHYVVDSSVAAKWYLEEEHSDLARSLLSSQLILFAPTLIDAELANIMWKKVRRNELDAEAAAAHVRHFAGAPLRRLSIRRLVNPAVTLAIETDRSVYDSMYVVLGVRRGAKLVTADRKLRNGLAGTAYANHVLWIGDLETEV